MNTEHFVIMPNSFFDDPSYQGYCEAELERMYSHILQSAVERGEGVSHISVRADMVRAQWDIRLHFTNGGCGLSLETDSRGMGLSCRGIQLLDVDEFSLRRYELSRKNEAAVRMYVLRKLSKVWRQEN
ncbi:UNVERIFIED_ORG: hypothetical protein J2Y81_000763 [Paraburkholderia sediminicola]|nr:hypothetical protein [Paraburkholderia sediminicola]